MDIDNSVAKDWGGRYWVEGVHEEKKVTSVIL